MYSQSEMQCNQCKLYFHWGLYIHGILNVQCKYVETMTEWKSVVFFVEILFAVYPSSPEKKNMTKKWWCFGLLVGPFKVAATPPIALFSVGIVVYILVMIYYYPVSCLMIWSVFFYIHKKKSGSSLRNREERENFKFLSD